MYQAKTGGGGAALYERARDEFSRERLRIVDELRHGIANNQLVLWYQPQIDAATQQVRGFEALVRWNHPRQGLLSPVAFLPAARHAGLMPAISESVIRRATTDLVKWQEAGMTAPVSLNCAPPELLSGVFVRQLAAATASAGLRPDDFVIEVTEDSFISDPERARELVLQLRNRGLQVSIDDYGTGFSSLAYLRDLPIDELKIDRSFVRTITTDRRSEMIVESTIRMAHALDLRVVAEGVEDAATAAKLIATGADVLQGYHLARPMPAEEVVAWTRNWRSGPVVADLGGLDR
jgi:EAL domain-containing protein (putative c-di-GMP-specific phosphodiesterase class I)